MGLNVNLCRMLGVPETVECPKCHNQGDSNFDDYDIECGNCNPDPGIWNLHCYCQECDHDWRYKVQLILKGDPT